MEIKISATFIIPGRTLRTEAECQNDETLYTNVTLKTFNGKKYKKYHWKERTTIPSTQVINMSEEAYQHMTDPQACPNWCRQRDWLQLSKKKRIESHLDMIANDLKGIVKEYEIFQ